MGIGGISIWQLLIILLLVVLLFGSGKLKSLGADLGKSIKGFKKALSDEEAERQPDAPVSKTPLEDKQATSSFSEADTSKVESK